MSIEDQIGWWIVTITAIWWIVQQVNIWLKKVRLNDPVYSCEVHKEIGCSHVDGFLCDMKDCAILKEYRIQELTNEK